MTGLHEVRVNGKSVGLFMSRVGTSEGPIKDLPLVVFRRDGMTDEEYRLLGYAWPDGDVMRTFVLREFGKAPRFVAKETRLPLLESETIAILMAALPQ